MNFGSVWCLCCVRARVARSLFRETRLSLSEALSARNFHSPLSFFSAVSVPFFSAPGLLDKHSTSFSLSHTRLLCSNNYYSPRFTFFFFFVDTSRPPSVSLLFGVCLSACAYQLLTPLASTLSKRSSGPHARCATPNSAADALLCSWSIASVWLSPRRRRRPMQSKSRF